MEHLGILEPMPYLLPFPPRRYLTILQKPFVRSLERPSRCVNRSSWPSRKRSKPGDRANPDLPLRSRIKTRGKEAFSSPVTMVRTSVRKRSTLLPIPSITNNSPAAPSTTELTCPEPGSNRPPGYRAASGRDRYRFQSRDCPLAGNKALSL